MTQIMTYAFVATAEVLENLNLGVPNTVLSFNRKSAFSGPGILEAFQTNRVGTDKCSSIKVEDRIFD